MELLAPAGNWDSFIAAINNGADAVYLGGQQYGARQSAGNFDNKQLLEAIEYAHLRDRKIYVTVNTLIDNNEFAEVLDYLFELQNAGADAVILQDMGLLNAVRTVLPSLRIHASTQMTIHNQDGVSFLRNQGVKRIVLARELSLSEITAIHQAVNEAELEVFIHGALCYCYSGQCLFSSMVGGRSGNRGRCAQPCRMPYELYKHSDRQRVILPEQGRYLLSPADLCLIEYLSELQKAGVASLKIEGRMKRPEYVAVVTKAYREALDSLQDDPSFQPEAALKDRLLRIFNRNFSSGYIIGDQTELLSTRRPNNRGVYVGRVVDQNREMLTRIKLSDTVSLGDGLVVWVGQGQAPASIVKEIKVAGKNVKEARPGEIMEIKLEGRVFANDRVFKTHDEKLLSDAQQSIRVDTGSRIPVDAEVYIAAGQALRLIIADRKGNRVEVVTQTLAQPAEQHPLNEESLRQKIGRLGNTPFELKHLIIYGDRDLLVPFSDINDARRRAVESLLQKILMSKQTAPIDAKVYWTGKDRFLVPPSAGITLQEPLLTVVVSSIEQAEQSLANGADRVYLGMEGVGDRRHLQKSHINELLQLNLANAERIVSMLPRIHHPADDYSCREMVGNSFGSVVIASWADLEWALQSGLKILADYTLNIFNRYTLRYLSQLGVNCICLSPELNMEQLTNFGDIHNVELIVHGDLILMQSQYCLLGGVLGGSRKNCQAHCVSDRYYIQDSKGYEFPVATDADCRFYVFNSRTLCMIEDLPRIIALAPAAIRIEGRLMTNENLGDTVRLYRQAMDELLQGFKPELSIYKQELSTISKSSFTKGHYYRGVL